MSALTDRWFDFWFWVDQHVSEGGWLAIWTVAVLLLGFGLALAVLTVLA